MKTEPAYKTLDDLEDILDLYHNEDATAEETLFNIRQLIKIGKE